MKQINVTLKYSDESTKTITLDSTCRGIMNHALETGTELMMTDGSGSVIVVDITEVAR